jgi:hypothetical protein
MTCQCLLAVPSRVPTRCVSKLSVGVSELREQPESGGLGVGGRLKGGSVQSGPGHTMQACQQRGSVSMEIMTAARGRVEREKGQLGSACIMLGAAGGGWLWQQLARVGRVTITLSTAAQSAICPLLLAWVHGVDETWALCSCPSPVLVRGACVCAGLVVFLVPGPSTKINITSLYTHNPHPTTHDPHDSTYAPSRLPRPPPPSTHPHQHALRSARSYAPRLARAVAVPRPASHHAPGRIAIAQFPRRGH